LDDTQRKHLFSILKDLETKGDLTGTSLNEGLAGLLKGPAAQQPSKNTSSKTSSAVAKKSSVQQRSRNELIIRVLSTLGNPHVCGLTEVELFDTNAEKIPLSSSCILVRNQGKVQKCP